MKKNILLIISIIILLVSIGILGYLYYQNSILNKDINSFENNIHNVEEKVNNDKKEIDAKENEYEKLKETVKEQLEELSIWEETKEKLNQSLS